MKLKDLLSDMKIEEMNASPETEIAAVRYSSKEVQQGDLFVAVAGYATDGHKYIPDAVRRGAAVIVCQHEMPSDCPWVRVESSRAALAQLGANYFDHPARSMQIIGVTGTNGKTSVTYLLKELLERAIGAKVGLIGTICNMIGQEELATERTTPESYELQALLAKMRDAGCTHVVMEVSSHALCLHRVDEIAFRVGAFTNLTEDHLDFHKTMENYLQAKALLFQKCAIGVLNADDPASERMAELAACPCRTVGTDAKAQIRGEDIVLAADHVEMTVCEGEQKARMILAIPGRFTVQNALLAVAVARQLEIPLNTATAALCGARGVKGRIEVVPTPGTDYTVLIDYAHTPDGLENILSSVRDFCKGRLIVLFGCGGDRDRAKRPLMGEIAERLADIVIVTSDNPRTEEPSAILRDILAGMRSKPALVEENRRRAIREALRFARKDDIVVLAGKGHETYQVIGKEKTHLDEREEVASALWESSH